MSRRVTHLSTWTPIGGEPRAYAITAHEAGEIRTLPITNRGCATRVSNGWEIHITAGTFILVPLTDG